MLGFLLREDRSARAPCSSDAVITTNSRLGTLLTCLLTYLLTFLLTCERVYVINIYIYIEQRHRNTERERFNSILSGVSVSGVGRNGYQIKHQPLTAALPSPWLCGNLQGYLIHPYHRGAGMERFSGEVIASRLSQLTSATIIWNQDSPPVCREITHASRPKCVEVKSVIGCARYCTCHSRLELSGKRNLG